MAELFEVWFGYCRQKDSFWIFAIQKIKNVLKKVCSYEINLTKA
jgi:hypothetical protein